jgi:hypothetical protein
MVRLTLIGAWFLFFVPHFTISYLSALQLGARASSPASAAVAGEDARVPNSVNGCQPFCCATQAICSDLVLKCLVSITIPFFCLFLLQTVVFLFHTSKHLGLFS